MKHRIATVALTLSAFLLVFTAAVSFPILFRPFYYWQIKALGIERWTGYSYDTIRTAYDALLDYLVLNKPFSTGALAWSAEGMAHFADCKVIFRVIFALLGISAVSTAVLYLLKKKGKFRLCDWGGFSLAFYVSIAILLLLATVLVWGLIDFESLFTAFHAVFFPGKDNWTFDPMADQIIDILPNEFFVGCGVLIGGSLAVYSIYNIVSDSLRFRRKRAEERESL